ncbi:MAG: ABC transporter ATP-binding protein [Dehalococcoidales bacterium]|nr:ABC transporter ATP-binding protein [Dehalococcoidales bacterium]
MIDIKNLSVDLGEFVLKNVSLSIEEGDYYIILGPTGAGKTVLLESIAGLHPITSGEIWLRGTNVTSLEPEKRNIGIVYQDHVLFPHLTVKDNICFGLKIHKMKREAIAGRLDWLVDLLGISHLLHRKPTTLSGGEKQKVSLARALSTSPEILMIDEPLSALDPETRESVQQELKQLHRKLGITIVHVTHDFEEALSLGTKIAVIGEGELKQTGTPEDIFRRPDSEFVARFAMARNIIKGTVLEQPGQDIIFRSEGTDFVVASGEKSSLTASIRPEDIIISLEPIHSSARNCFRGTITRILDKGSILYITAGIPPELTSLVTRHSFEEMELKEGNQVYLTFKASSIHLF